MADIRRTLVSIEQFSDNSLSARVEEAATGVARRTRTLEWRGWDGALEDETALLAYGDQLRDALYGHPEVGKALDAVFGAPAHETWSLVFDVVGPVGEAIRWEALRTPKAEAVALRLKPRLCRVAAETGTAPLARRPLPDPLRMCAFLSAAREPARTEFLNLLAVIRTAREKGLALELIVYVAEDELLDMDLADQPWVTVRTMPGDTQALELELTAAKAHLLHFFCHGASEPIQHLEFATLLEQARRQDGTVRFSTDRLIDCQALQGAWAVVFNCCDGGRPTSALHSMAFRAVAQGGVPAAVGMGAPIPAAAAAIFAKSFYTGLFDQLAAIAGDADAQPATVDFGMATAQARMQLHEALPAPSVACTAWSLPIIYLHRHPLTIERSGDVLTPKAEVRLRLITGLLKTLPPGSPPEMRQAVWNMFDEEPRVPPAFRTDLNGDPRPGPP